jgi:hypothetical protein
MMPTATTTISVTRSSRGGRCSSSSIPGRTCRAFADCLPLNRWAILVCAKLLVIRVQFVGAQTRLWLSDAMRSPTCGMSVSHAGTTAVCGGRAFLRGDDVGESFGRLLGTEGVFGATLAAALSLRVARLGRVDFYWV